MRVIIPASSPSRRRYAAIDARGDHRAARADGLDIVMLVGLFLTYARADATG